MIAEYKMLADRVLIKSVQEDITAGGVIIPDSTKERPKTGEIILVGPGKKDIEMVLLPGDTVLFGEYAGTKTKLDGIEYLIMQQDDVLMITKRK